MKACAYCEKNLPVTREHIWSDCLIEKYENLSTYSKRDNKFYKGDPTIKDVCGNCNNVLLSKLDAYLCVLYDGLFHRILMPSEGMRIEYDYDMLLRALLKISYNSSRANASDKVIKAHRNLAKYILHGQFRQNVALRLLVVTASRAINLDAGSESLLEPKHLRCAEFRTMVLSGTALQLDWWRLTATGSTSLFRTRTNLRTSGVSSLPGSQTGSSSPVYCFRRQLALSILR